MSLNQQHKTRIHSLDILRGLVIVVMALDHVRDFFGPAPFTPEDVTQTFPLLFFTRWITHFCAPIFVFLAGTSAFLYGEKTGKKALTTFLLSRGLWLIFIELVVINPSWTFAMPYSTGWAFVQVIWVIGWSMIFLAGFIWLPRWAIASISLALIFGHNLLDSLDTQEAWGGFWLWKTLHVGMSWIQINKDFGLFIAYPLIPWIGVMGIGYVFGQVMKLDTDKRKRFLMQYGLGIISLFFALRSLNVYGDSSLWSIQERGLPYSIISFFNVTKYPPSLLYLLMTLGPALILLIPLERWKGHIADFFRIFGRVPFFFYTIHLVVINICAQTWNYFMYDKVFNFFSMNSKNWPENYELNLGIVYGAWAVIVLGLFFACRWYNRYKHSHNYWILKYL